MPSPASAVNLPFKEAVDFFRQKTDTPSAHWTAVMDDAHARSFAVAGATKDALIGDFRKAVDKAIATGTSYGEFRKDFDSLVKKYGWSHTGTADWRAKVIYNTNLATAFAAGRYAQMTDPDVLAAFPYWQYQHVNCPNPRLQHVAWSGMVLRADDPFWATCYPPNGWGCHCIVLSVSERGLAKMGKSGPDKTPTLQWQEYVNRTTGVVTKYPAGVDPGFVSNPGKAWLESKQQDLKAPSVRPQGPPPPVLAPPGKTAVPPEVLRRFIEKPDGAVQIGVLPKDLAASIGARHPTVLLSAETFQKQVVNHSELTQAAYEAAEQLIAKPLAVFENRDKHLRLLGVVDGQALTAVVKRTSAGDSFYLQSFHYVNAKTVRQFGRQFKLIKGSLEVVLEQLAKRVR